MTAHHDERRGRVVIEWVTGQVSDLGLSFPGQAMKLLRQTFPGKHVVFPQGDGGLAWEHDHEGRVLPFFIGGEERGRIVERSEWTEGPCPHMKACREHVKHGRKYRCPFGRDTKDCKE